MSDDTKGPVRPRSSGGEDGRGSSASDLPDSPWAHVTDTGVATASDDGSAPADPPASRHDDTGARTGSTASSEDADAPTDSTASRDSADARAGRTASLRAVDTDLAPVIPLFGVSAATRSGRASEGAHPSRGRAAAADPTTAGDVAVPRSTRPRLRALRSDTSSGESAHDSPAAAWNLPGGDSLSLRATDSRGTGADADVDDALERAEALLLRKLRSRSLSLAEARTALRGVDGADEVVIEELIAKFVDLGYLDDAAFAEQLAMSAIEKRGEGRRAVAETLRKRGIPRDVAEAALAELPDDDAERALEFARTKVRGVDGKDYDASLRRLAGQLARRGYPSSVALSAAKTALSEAGIGRSRSFSRPTSGVRFTPDD